MFQPCPKSKEGLEYYFHPSFVCRLARIGLYIRLMCRSRYIFKA